jgi:DNA polymerase (family 10)
LEARGANPYRVRAYQRAALRLLRMREDAATYLDERGELDLPGLGQRLRRKLGELVRTGHLSFHDELIAAEPRPIRALMTVPGIGPKTADRLVGEARVRGLKSLARAAREGRLRRLRGIGPAREQAWGEAAELLVTPEAGRRGPHAMAPAGATGGESGPVQIGLFDAIPPERALVPTETVADGPVPAEAAGLVARQRGPERAA